MRDNVRRVVYGFMSITAVIAATSLIVFFLLFSFLHYTDQIDVFVTTGSMTAIFDDCDHECTEYELLGLREGHRAEVVLKEKIRYVGSINNIAEITFFDKNDNDITYKYRVHQSPGTLNIIPAEYNIMTGSAYGKYNGEAVKNEKYDMWGLLEGHRATLNFPAITDAKKIPNIPEVTIFDATGRNISDQYEPVGDYGFLEISPAELTVRSADAKTEYTGEPVGLFEYIITKGKLVGNDEIVITFPYKYTARGEYDNFFELSVIRNENGTTKSVSSNYIIIMEYGRIRID